VNNPTSRDWKICGAKTRHGLCSRPPHEGRNRCRLHGGLSPGAPVGSRNGNYTEGNWTKQAYAERQWLRSLMQALKLEKPT